MRQPTLKISSREGLGRNASNRLRQAGRIPGVLYSRHSPPAAISMDYPEMRNLLLAVGDRTTLVELSREGSASSLSIIKEVQKDALTDKITHVDFQEVKADEKIEVYVNVHLVGEAYGVKTEGGILDLVAHRLLIRCLPKDLPPTIDVDVTELKVGQNLHVSEIKPPAGVEFRSRPGLSVVACTEAVAEVAAATPAAGDAKAAAPAAGDAKKAAAPAAKAPAKK